jgi:hypothetical protein
LKIGSLGGRLQYGKIPNNLIINLAHLHKYKNRRQSCAARFLSVFFRVQYTHSGIKWQLLMR